VHHCSRVKLSGLSQEFDPSEILKLARSDVPILISGETGTGKDRTARWIHEKSRRAPQPFVILDCASLAPQLAESELFGHERGAFTGANAAFLGAFERGHLGSVFLDEIGELPLGLQPRLLRVLETQQVQRLGATQRRFVDIRIICATNRNLLREVEQGNFRQDLYFRLAVGDLHLRPLRERTDELPELAAKILEELGHSNWSIDPDCWPMLRSNLWPGNLRELRNVLACAVTLTDGTCIRSKDLIGAGFGSTGEPPALQLAGLDLGTLERATIEKTLELMQGNRARAAESLGIALSTLYEKMRRYGIVPARARRD
jgi:DNA-binding NtrC family response regulator